MLEINEHCNSTVGLLCIPWTVLAREFRVKQVIPGVLVGVGAQPVPLLPGVQNSQAKVQSPVSAPRMGSSCCRNWVDTISTKNCAEPEKHLFCIQLVFQWFSEEKTKENLEKILQGRESELMITPLVVEPVVSVEDPEISFFPLTFGQCKWKTFPFCFRHRGSQGCSEETSPSLVINRKAPWKDFYQDTSAETEHMKRTWTKQTGSTAS